MKKIISLVFVVVMLFACTVPAFAEDFMWQSGTITITEDTIYESFNLDEGADVTIENCNVEITKLLMFLDHGTLRVWSNASLTGENLIFDMFGYANAIIIKDGFINLSFKDFKEADNFEQLLKDSHVEYTRSGNHIVAGCSHSEWEDGVCTRCGIHCLHETYDNCVCITCGYECTHENGYTNERCNDCGWECPHTQTHTRTFCDCCGIEIESTATGSILSQGYPEIVFGIGGIAIGVVATLLFSRKKKVAVSSTAADDEE